MSRSATSPKVPDTAARWTRRRLHRTKSTSQSLYSWTSRAGWLQLASGSRWALHSIPQVETTKWGCTYVPLKCRAFHWVAFARPSSRRSTVLRWTAPKTSQWPGFCSRLLRPVAWCRLKICPNASHALLSTLMAWASAFSIQQLWALMASLKESCLRNSVNCSVQLEQWVIECSKKKQPCSQLASFIAWMSWKSIGSCSPWPSAFLVLDPSSQVRSTSQFEFLHLPTSPASGPPAALPLFVTRWRTGLGSLVLVVCYKYASFLVRQRAHWALAV